MNIFGIGLPEMGIIAVVALLIFGPDKLPEVMGQAGKLVKDFRSMTSNLTGEFEKTIAEAKDLGNSLTSELGGMTKEVNSVTNSVKRDLNKATSSSKTPAKTSTTSTSTTASKSTSASTGSTNTSTTTVVPSTPKASKEDPILDISLYEPTPIERKNRARRATPAAMGDLTPRMASVAETNVDADDTRTGEDLVAIAPSDDAVQRARARRRNAGYTRQSA